MPATEFTEEEKHLHRIEGGYKATLSNPNSSEEAKKHAQEQLDKIAKGEKIEAANSTEKVPADEAHLHHIEGGYKATLSNPNASEEAKKHAQEQLDKIAKGEKPEHAVQSRSSEATEDKNPGNVIGGYRATLSNPNTSEQAKQHAREELKKLGASEEDDEEKKGLKRSSETEVTSSPKKQKELTEEEKHLHHIEGGYKATLTNPNSSEEAKKHAQEQLDKIAKGEKPEEGSHSRSSEEEKNLGNVIGGYKGTLSNPNTSEEAKQHAREELKKLGALEEDSKADSKEKEEKESSGHKKQGFAAMPTEKVKEIASKGGRTAHAGEEPAPLKNQ